MLRRALLAVSISATTLLAACVPINHVASDNSSSAPVIPVKPPPGLVTPKNGGDGTSNAGAGEVTKDPADVAREILKHGHPGPIADRLYRQAYVGSYDRRTRNPAWVAEVLTRESLTRPPSNPDEENDPTRPKVPGRQRSQFKEDGQIPAMFRGKVLDFAGSGYDRGHMVPAADVISSQLAVDETFLMSNISPQTPAFNRGIWASMERFVRGLVLSGQFDAATVVTGPLYLPKLEEDGRFYVRYE
ncbi:nuclease, partial [Irineochytrium annulatum]